MNYSIAFLTGCLLGGSLAQAYPIDGYPYSGIRRVDYTWRVHEGEISGRALPQGATLPLDDVIPSYAAGDAPPFTLEPDADLSRRIRGVLGDEAKDYAVSLLDLSDPDSPVYAEHNGDIVRNIGSVGKLIVGLSWFQTLADVYPDDISARERLLRDTVIAGDEFVISDHHKVLFFDPETTKKAYRTIQVGDTGSLWDWMDWMLSASNNSAASIIQKQIVLLKHFGKDYPPSPEQEAAFLTDTPKTELGEQFVGLMTEPMIRNGLDDELMRQGSFFTRTGKSKIPGTRSYGNVRELVRFLYLLERGELVDSWSSREMKRLLYMTQRRIRYASHPVLNPYAVYFKSGSLYKCEPEEGFECKQYQGNALNLLASVAIVDGPVPTHDFHYLVAVSSNVLRKNSAVAHQTLALRIHRMLEERKAERTAQEPAASDSGTATTTQ